MTPEHISDSHADTGIDAELPAEQFEEEFANAGDHHRMAAQHFSAAAKHHLAAAEADDEGDREANARHGYLAYRHQLNAVQYAEIAVMDNECLDDEFDQAATVE